MKRGLKIVLVGILIIFSCIILSFLFDFFYPQNYIKNENGDYINITTGITNDTFPITKDTIFIIEHYYPEENRTLKEEINNIPALLGCNKDGLNRYLTDYMKYLSIEDQEKGLELFELLSYNNNKIYLRKTYRKKNHQGFYLKSFNGTIVILNGDKKTVYDYTKISIHVLPDELQKKVIEGFYIENEEDLYNFLETYTS